MKYVSTKEYKELGPVAYRQWKDDGNCRLVHGYALSFYFEFEASDLDSRNWVVDFGSLQPLKEQLEEWFDHTLLVAVDDPHRDKLIELHKAGIAKVVEVERTGCEGLAEFIYRWINDPQDGFLKHLGYGDRVWCRKVMVRETEKNMAFVEGSREDWRDL